MVAASLAGMTGMAATSNHRHGSAGARSSSPLEASEKANNVEPAICPANNEAVNKAEITSRNLTRRETIVLFGEM